MKIGKIAALAVLLGGCTEDDRSFLFSYDKPAEAVAAPAPVAVASASQTYSMPTTTVVATDAPAPLAAPPAAPVRMAEVPRETIVTPAPPVAVTVAAPQPVPRETIVTTTVAAPLPVVATSSPAYDAAVVQCRAVAAQRASDAGLNGHDEAMQKIVSDSAFGDCMTWAPKTGVVL